MTLKELAQHLTELAKLNPNAPVYFGVYPSPDLMRICTLKLVQVTEEPYVFLGQ